MFPTWIGITLIVFMIVRFAPGRPGSDSFEAGHLFADGQAASLSYYQRKLGLDQPLYKQYFSWWKSLFTTEIVASEEHQTRTFEFTLGYSLTSRSSVVSELKRRLPITLLISTLSIILIYIVAIPTGLLMAVKRGRRFDIGSNALLLALWSVPIVLVATLLIGYTTTGSLGVQWFPNNGLSSIGSERLPFFAWLVDRAWHLILPVVCISLGGFAYLAKQTRAAVLENLSMDYVRTAKAKGVSGINIIKHHVFRNSLLPLITIFATLLPFMLAGSVIVEKIFNIEGMGLFTFRAVMNRDYDVVQAMALIAGVLNSFGLLVADITYAAADPRINYR